MIKLIITDLDGTLLKDDKQFPIEFGTISQQLQREGITWVLASGRQYFTIFDQFEAVLPDAYYLAENGAYVVKNSQQIHIAPLDKELCNRLILNGRKVKDAWPVLCGKNSAYIENDYKPLLDEVKKYYKRLTIVDDLTKVDDTVLKLTLCDFNNAEANSYTYFKEFQHQCKVAVAGELWLDMTALNATKGTALQVIMKHCHVEPSEVMAFGDYLNDLEMIEIAHTSYAMKNAHDELKEAATKITRFDNNNNGVIEELKEYFKMD